jgi:biopolymer transport protein TolR
MPGVQASESGASRGRRGRRVSSSLSEINVVPLVDVMLVLLVIFMVTAPMIQRGVEVNLPATRKADRIEGDRFFVTVPADYARNGRVFLGEEAVRIDLLPERIRQRFETTTDKQVYLRGDGSVLYKDLMDVFSRLMDAGVNQVGLVTDPPRKR